MNKNLFSALILLFFQIIFSDRTSAGQDPEVHVDHYGGEDNGRTHAPTPFYISSKGYGVFVNAARYIDVYAGTAARKDSPDAPEARDRNTDESRTSSPYSDAVEKLVPTHGGEVYLFAGPSPLDAIRRYNLFNGGGPLPPRWGMGFTQRVHRLYSAEDVISEAKEFEERGFPLDFIGLEPGWQSKSYPNTFEWDKGGFPEPEKLIKDLQKMKVKVNLWINPYVSPDAGIYSKILPFTGNREFAKYHYEGTPPFRAMDLEEGFHQEHNAQTLKDAEVNLEENPYAEAVRKGPIYGRGKFTRCSHVYRGNLKKCNIATGELV